MQSYQTYIAPEKRIAIKEDLRRQYFQIQKNKRYGESEKASSVANIDEKLNAFKNKMAECRG